jgi:tRNA (mo5U34)-methyltransferase
LNIQKLILERQKWYEWKNIKPLRDSLYSLQDIENLEIDISDIIKINSQNISKEEKEKVYQFCLNLKPWRKGLFEVFGTFIDTEWKSFIKYNLLEKHFNLEGRDVADIGCNNGYYMFRMLKQKPKSLVGFDPSPLYKTQFDFINHYVKSNIVYEMLGVEHLPHYGKKFDVIFCLGVLYHRNDPVVMLKQLKQGLKKNGEIFLDTFIISGEEPFALCPNGSYLKIPNISFVPTLNALKNWCIKAGFNDIQVLHIKESRVEEQRKTSWINTQSLEDFLDPNDKTKTYEGHEAPKRAYLKLKI